MNVSARPDRARIAGTAFQEGDLRRIGEGTRVIRIHPLAGRHPTAWDAMRSFGPTSARFDHHPLPTRVHPSRSIAYPTHGPTRFVAAVAEYFQDGSGGVGPIDRMHGLPVVTQFELATDVELLDLDGGWVTRAGGNQAITSGRRSRAREWARAIYTEHGDVQGLMFSSSIWGPGRCIALWDRGASAIPTSPLTSRRLDDPVLDAALANTAIELGTYVI